MELAPINDLAQVLEQAPVAIEPRDGRRFRRSTAGTLLLTLDELVVIAGPAESPQVVLRHGRSDMAMVRRPTPRGGERVELSALDGQHATLRFTRADASSAGVLAAWLAGLPFTA